MNSEPVKCKFMLWTVKTVFLKTNLQSKPIFQTHCTCFWKYMCLLHIEVLVICWQQHRDNYEHVICICLFHGNWTVQYHEQRQRLVCALYTYLQSLSLLVKLSDLLLLANLAKMSLFTHFVAFWRNVVIYALCRILIKCRDLRIFPGKKMRIPGTKNYYGGLVGPPWALFRGPRGP